MPPSLRSRGPLCHYCNRWSSSRFKGARRFQCENCLAENFLDEHGEIVDVPPEETSSPRQVARPFAKPLPNDQSNGNAATFCSTCLKNQHLLTETLANYLPSSGDPSYKQYEESYPEFRQKLEERYPPVCARCEPGARQRIQEAGYTAKSDHLRRMMERSRVLRISSSWGWRSLVVTLGAFLFWTSFMGQLAWNIIGMLEVRKSNHHDTSTAIASRAVHCVAQVLKKHQTDEGCAVASAPLGLASVVLGLLSIWWNPKWQHRLQGREGRLIGLEEYYKVNTTVLLARFGFWVWARDSAILSSSNEGRIAIHFMAMMLTLVFTIYTTTRVQVDTLPLVSWQESPIQLLSQRQFNPAANPGMDESLSSPSICRPQASNARPFPISSLAPEQRRQIWQAPTPPSDEDSDAMEWEPSQGFQPKPRRLKLHAIPGPSPFHGALPAMPTNRLLHPQSQRQPAQKEAIGLPPGFFDKRDDLCSKLKPAASPAMAQPKFFSQGDRDADTGLEAIFDSVFSLRDAPPVSKAVAEQSLSHEPERSPQDRFVMPLDNPIQPRNPLKLKVKHAAKFSVLFVGLTLVYVTQEFGLDVPRLELVVVCIAGLVSLSSVLSQSKKAHAARDISELVWSGAMSLGACYLALQDPDHDSEEALRIDKHSVMGLLILCICWEIPRLVSCEPRSSSDDKVGTPVGEHPAHAVHSSGPAASDASRASKGRLSGWHGPQPLPYEAQSSSSQTTRWEPGTIKPQPFLRAQDQRPSYRTRSDSTDSAASQNSVTTIASTTTGGWRTPSRRGQHLVGAPDQSPGFNLRSLALDDGSQTPRLRRHNALGSRSTGLI